MLQNEVIVGFAELSNDDRISAFYCHHLRQPRGIGSALPSAIEIRAESNGIDSIRVEASQSASRFFIDRGFCQQDKIQHFTDGIASTSVMLTKTADASTD